MEYGLYIVFWYGLLHAISPDHLVAIANFSIGKSKFKTIFVTVLFAVGHGVAIFLLAILLSSVDIGDHILAWGDTISAAVILGLGLYLLYMVVTDQIQLKRHIHKDKEHVHIWFGKDHTHDRQGERGAFGIGVLMGIGGVRGAIISLGAISGGEVGLGVVLMFVLGVSVVFLVFGAVMLYINQNLLKNKRNIKLVLATTGAVSVAVGAGMLI